MTLDELPIALEDVGKMGTSENGHCSAWDWQDRAGTVLHKALGPG